MKTTLVSRFAALLLGVGVPLANHAASTIEFAKPTTVTVLENVGEAILAVVRTGDVDAVATVDFATVDGTAKAGSDYTTAAGTLTFEIGQTNQMIRVPIFNDALPEATERFTVKLSNPSSSATLGAVVTATVSITDNDKGLHLELSNYSVNEDAGVIRVRVLRRDDGDSPVSVDYATTSLTAVAGTDYLDAAGTLTFASRDTVNYVTVTLLNDAVPETSKTLRITLSNPTAGGVLGTPVTATVRIADTDDVVQFPVAGFTNREDAALIRIPVVRGESALASTVDVTTANGTAVAGQDYAAVNRTLSFLPGERLKFVDVPVLNDGLKESSETFRILLGNPTGGAALGATRTVKVTILDNDPGVGFERSTNSVWGCWPGLILTVVRGNDGWGGAFTVD